MTENRQNATGDTPPETMASPGEESAEGWGGRPALGVPTITVPARLHGDCHLLLWQLHGRTDVHLASGPRVLPGGHACWIPAGVQHRLHVAADSVVFPLFLRLELGASGLPPGAVLRIPRAQTLLLMALLQQQYGDALSATVDLEARVAALVAGLEPAARPPAPRSAEAQTVAAAFLEDLSDTRSIAEVVAANYSVHRTVQRQFLAETGMTPHQWRTRLRLAEALDLLRMGASVTDTARRCGYTSASAFRRAFTSRYGAPPGRYAKTGTEKAPLPGGNGA
ncbi:AraC family transcriptional regulator [Kocuria sp.]|uniref:helix-turn-helix transcriptional regulator n=1 Tax=Kocuria sp. TaxID=1871328 RepID=UPI0026DDB2C3|nr:AraC family transcriptional regulator [Kocuria sp.]MDO4920141.1 AraC family transcriptional regulator [Kocuria sp.]